MKIPRLNWSTNKKDPRRSKASFEFSGSKYIVTRFTRFMRVTYHCNGKHADTLANLADKLFNFKKD